MKKIAVLGMGAMGSRMAARLLVAGHGVTVWSRMMEKARPVLEQGAKWASSPRQAAASADFVIAMVRDDAASRQVWLDPDTGALSGMKTGAVAIDSSTLSLSWVRELGAAAADLGVAFLEAPVSGSRPQAEAGQLIYFAGGDAAACRTAEPVLLAMGKAVHHVGPVGCAALTKLCTNALLGIQVTALAEIIGLLDRNGLDAGRILAAIGSTAVWSPVAGGASAGMLAGLQSGEFTPQFPVDLIEKDFGYALEAAGSPELAPTIAAARQAFGRAMAQGMSADNMTGVVRLYARQGGEVA